MKIHHLLQLLAATALTVLSGTALRAQSNYATPYAFTTLAGSGFGGSADGTGGAASFRGPNGIAVDAAGNLYVSDADFSDGNTIRKITSGGVVTTFAGMAVTGGGWADGTGSAARFCRPNCVAVDSVGNVYVTDGFYHTIRKITAEGVVTTLAGASNATGGSSSVAGGYADGPGRSARFNAPYGIAADSAGNVYVADAGNHTIRKITSAGVVSTLAGTAGSSGSVDGPGSAARFNRPSGVVLDGAGNLYVADGGNHTIRKITSGGVVSTIAGAAGSQGSADGTGSAARFYGPLALAIDAAGNLYLADCENYTIRKITSAGVVTTLAGAAGKQLERGYGPDYADGTGSAARFFFPNGVAVDAAGKVYVADSYTRTVKVGVLAAPIVLPVFTGTPTASTSAGQSFSYTPTFSGAPNVYTASGLPAGLSISSTTGVISGTRSTAGTYSIVLRATNSAGTTTATITLVVLERVVAPAITTQVASQSTVAGGPATFSVVATGSPTYQWRKDGVAIAGATGATLTFASTQASDAGAYTVVVTNAAGSVTSNAGTLTVGASRLINLSILTSVAAPGESFTMGYVVGGTGTSGAKPLVIRAAGPSLGALGVGGTLDDPKLELFAGSTKTGENDNWGGSATVANAMAAVGAFAYSGPTSRDATSALSVASGDNSVKVSAVGSGTGAVIAEIYDATPAESFTGATPRLLNVSVLKPLGAGFTVGFVVGGNISKNVLVRAIGPTLGTAFLLGGVVSDPQLTLFSGQTVIGANDNWGGGAPLTSAFASVAAFVLPPDSKDAAVTAALNPGNYTVQVSGVSGVTGTILVEIYELP